MSFDIYPAVIEFDCPALMLLDSSLIYFIVYFLRRQLDYALLVNKDSSTSLFINRDSKPWELWKNILLRLCHSML